MNPDTAAIFIPIISFLVGLSIGLALWVRLKNANEKIRGENNMLAADLSSSRQIHEHLQNQYENAQNQLSSLSEELRNKSSYAAKLEAEKQGLIDRLESQQKELKELKEQFTKEFENLANRIFDEKTEKFTQQNKLSLDRVIEPLKERIKEFQEKVEKTHSSSLKETSSLRQELVHLKEMSHKMSVEAENLTKALKNDSKTQGNWGEMILETILEGSGLSKDREYFVQRSYSSENGRRLQPDVTIKLPDNKWIVVDSKVSLTAYERYSSAESEIEINAGLKEHLNSLRAHIKSLASKSYHDIIEGESLDFVLMFVPIEPAYLLALNKDQSLFNEAYKKGIVMVSPSTLIASLKVIASTWKHEYQNRNALEIAERGKLLLEKFIGFAEDFEKIGTHITRTEESYRSAMKKLKEGRGNLVQQAKQLEELGVKSNKQLSETFSLDSSE
jgi:DNA recombination protein RmuC